MFIRNFQRFMRALAALLCFTMAAYPFHTFGITPEVDRYDPWASGALLERIQTFDGMVEFDDDYGWPDDDWPAEQFFFLSDDIQNTSGHAGYDGDFVRPGGLGMLEGFSARTVSDDVYDADFCTTTTTVTRGATDNTQCITIKDTKGQDVKICPGDDLFKQLTPPPVPGIPPLALEVGVTADCGGFNQGQMDCYEDVNGDIQCPVNNGDRQDTCAELVADPSCTYVKSECIEGARGEESGHCYAYEDTYDCGTSVDIPTWEKTETFQCGGPVRCLGNDCIDPATPPSAADDFGKIAGLLDAAQSMAEDMDCKPDGTGCKVFTGEPRECKAAMGGWVNCCEKPKGVSLVDYIQTIRAMRTVDSAITGMKNAEGAFKVIQDGYTALRQPLANGFAKITQPFSSATSNISNAYKGLKNQAHDYATKLIAKGKELAAKSFGSASSAAGSAGGAAGGAAGSGAGSTEAAASLTEQILGAQVAAFLSVVMMIYAIYTIANLIVNIIWKCKKDELDLGVQRQLRNCSKVGTYCRSKFLGACIEKRTSFCCFNSPLSRILQEQIRPQLGMSFGPAKSPDCSGLPIDKFDRINWDRVNLDEWLGMLKLSGEFPGQDGINLDKLTGSGHKLDGIDGPRLNSLDRNIERLEGVDADAARKAGSKTVPLSTGAPGQ